MIAFALWFGGWGVLAAYIGCYLRYGTPWLKEERLLVFRYRD
jgi:hypothetical protein